MIRNIPKLFWWRVEFNYWYLPPFSAIVQL